MVIAVGMMDYLQVCFELQYHVTKLFTVYIMNLFNRHYHSCYCCYRVLLAQPSIHTSLTKRHTYTHKRNNLILVYIHNSVW